MIFVHVSSGVAAVFLVGCAVGGVSSRLVVPKASAQQAATLTKWEHHCSTEGNVGDLIAQSNALGAQSWEMTNVTDWGACFKRSKM